MAMKRETRDQRNRSPQEVARLREIRERFQREKPSLSSLVASGEFSPPIKQGEYFLVMQLAAMLKKERENSGLTLQNLSDATGIDRSAISRIENGVAENPTIGTIAKIAGSLGKRLVFAFEDDVVGIKKAEIPRPVA
jgi:ribosome-binding protein aMBF1 (putative translation factor)